MHVRLALLLAGALACTNTESGGAQQGKAPQKSGPPPAAVEVAPVEAGNLTDGWSFLGQVQPALSAELAPAVAGHVLKVNAREGDSVAKGKVLVSLDSAKIRAQLQAARSRKKGLETELAQAKRQLERVAKLDYPTVSEPERERYQLAVDNLEAQVQTQAAEVQRVRVELSQHSVKAPFAGVVRSRSVDPGAWVSAGESVMELVSLEEVEVHVDVTADLGSRLKAGEAATLRGTGQVAAEIAGVVPALDTETRTMRIRLIPTERPEWLIAGMAIDVEFSVEFEGRGVIVPRDALIRGPVQSRVVKVVDETGVQIPVDVIATSKDRVLVNGEGLKIGDSVVVRGNERLRPGQPLRIKEN